MPSAHAILWFLAAFSGLWACTLIFRGVSGDRMRGARRCPSCRKPAPGEGRTCAACGYEGKSERQMHAGAMDWRLIVAGVALLLMATGAGVFGVRVWRWTHPWTDVGFPLSLWDSMAVGVVCFTAVLAGWAIRGDRSRGRRRCPSCWYDMSGAGLKCPECGREMRHTRDLYRPRRRWKAAIRLSALLLVAVALQGVPRVQRGGWRAAVPTTVLIAVLPWVPDTLAFESDPTQREDWTLSGRIDAGRPWGWQAGWAKARGERMLARAKSARAVYRALHFADVEWTPALGARLLGPCITSLVGADDSERDAAAQCVTQLQAVFDPPSAALGTAVRPRLPELFRVMDDPMQPRAAAWAAGWLVSLSGAEGAPGTRRMLELMGSSGRLASIGWAWAIQRVAQASPEARATVVGALEDPDATIAAMAAMVIGGTGRSMCDDEAGERLLQILRGKDDGRAGAAAQALCRSRWKPSVCVPAVLDQVEAGRASRWMIANYVWWYKDDLLPSLDRIGRLLEDQDPRVRAAMISCVDALFEPGQRDLMASPVYPIIERLQRDADSNVSSAAAEMILRRKEQPPAAPTEPSTRGG